jgi:hypothetical protein
MKPTIALTLVILLAACEASAPTTIQAVAARNLAERYAQSRWASWKIQATAAGGDCTVLIVRTSIALDDSMVETLQYGTGARDYDIFKGGVQQFCRDHGFRGVAYRDSAGHLWTYGAMTTKETDALVPCQ